MILTTYNIEWDLRLVYTGNTLVVIFPSKKYIDVGGLDNDYCQHA